MSYDAGLEAVARVRGVRESDSRIGLVTAVADHAVIQAQVDDLHRQIEQAGAFQTGSATEFLALRQSLAALGDVLILAGSERDSSSLICAAALDRWHQDKSRLNAIEMLLQRRRDQRRETAARREARELDDIAAQRWLRQSVNGIGAA